MTTPGSRYYPIWRDEEINAQRWHVICLESNKQKIREPESKNGPSDFKANPFSTHYSCPVHASKRTCDPPCCSAEEWKLQIFLRNRAVYNQKCSFKRSFVGVMSNKASVDSIRLAPDQGDMVLLQLDSGIRFCTMPNMESWKLLNFSAQGSDQITSNKDCPLTQPQGLHQRRKNQGSAYNGRL